MPAIFSNANDAVRYRSPASYKNT
ncbi:hypothetical protein MNBD_GAMMA20-2396, partial [hydrothermal vent metagenome]